MLVEISDPGPVVEWEDAVSARRQYGFDSRRVHQVHIAPALRCDPGLLILARWCNSTRRHSKNGGYANGGRRGGGDCPVIAHAVQSDRLGCDRGPRDRAPARPEPARRRGVALASADWTHAPVRRASGPRCGTRRAERLIDIARRNVST